MNDSPCNNNNIGLAGTGPVYFHAKSGKVVSWCSCSHHLNTTTSCCKSQWPERIFSAPVNNIINCCQQDIGAGCIKKIKAFIILELFSLHSFYSHISACFFQAYNNPKPSMKKNITISIKAAMPV